MAARSPAAEQDPSIVGVIGLSADTSTSAAVMAEFAKADLVVVDTTNSSNSLAALWNYFGLSATNSEEASALQRYTADAVNRSAVIFQRQPATPDPYTQEQAHAAASMLGHARFRLIGGGPLGWTVNSDNTSDLVTSPAVNQVCESGDRPSVIYLAGRAEDLRRSSRPCSRGRTASPAASSCSAAMTWSRFEYPGTGQPPIPPQMTLY